MCYMKETCYYKIVKNKNKLEFVKANLLPNKNENTAQFQTVLW